VFEAEDIRDWRNRPVVDARGDRIGTLEAIYFDTLTDRPAFATVRIGRFGRARLAFVPLDRATVAPAHLRVQVERKLARRAPSISTDGALTAEAEPDVFEHYGMTYQRGSSGERRLGRR
jgi:hypothetical protein